MLNPWLSCAPRGIAPVCPACEDGDYSLCWNFHDGRLTAGIHTGNSSDATGGFADLLPAHKLMAIPVPDAIPDEVAVLADPFAVSLHAITRNPPPRGRAGPRLRRRRAGHDVGGDPGGRSTRRSTSAVVARFPQQAAWPRSAALEVFAPSPAST